MKIVLVKIGKGLLYTLGGGVLVGAAAALGSLIFTGGDISQLGYKIAGGIGCGIGFFYGLYRKFQ